MWMKKAPSARKMHNEKSLEVREKYVNPNAPVVHSEGVRLDSEWIWPSRFTLL